MRITVTPVSRPQDAFTLVDGSWLNQWPVDGTVCGLQRDGLDGWKNGVEPRYEAPEIPGGDGNYAPDEINLAARLLTIRGFKRIFSPASTVALAAFEDLLAALVGEWLTITVEDAAGARTVSGFVSAIPVNDRVSEWTVKFTLIVLCPDPLKYGQLTRFPAPAGAVVVSNAGTGRVFPVLEVTGPVTTVDVQVPGRRVRWVGVADGLALDFADAFPLSGGVEVGTLVDAELFRLPPGQTTISVATDGDLTIGVAPGWK